MKFEELLNRLQEFDLLLDTDPKFPSVTGFVAGDRVRGSWWAHPQSHEMYSLACRLRAHPDVLLVKLISGKVTLVHRPLWPAVFTVATAREPWQLEGLSKDAQALLRKVDKERVFPRPAIRCANWKSGCWFIRRACTPSVASIRRNCRLGNPGLSEPTWAACTSHPVRRKLNWKQ